MFGMLKKGVIGGLCVRLVADPESAEEWSTKLEEG